MGRDGFLESRTPTRWSKITSPRVVLGLFLVCGLVAAPAAAHVGGKPGSGGPYRSRPESKEIQLPRGEAPCPNEHPEWRNGTTLLGVEIEPEPVCSPDDPRLVAAFVKGTNHVNQSLLDRTGLHEDAIVKTDDRDRDGDYDVINLTLEVAELNGWHLPEDDLAQAFEIAPGVAPSFWTFTPKMTIHHAGDRFFRLARMPSTPMRFEAGDTVRVTLENTHYFPHTIHLHGFDHPFQDESGEGNDGVPHVSERPVVPGEQRTYEMTPREPGTFFYHCHVQPSVHVNMGLSTIAIVEEARANNTLQTLNPGGGMVRHPSQASGDRYDREYDMVYQAVYKELNEIPKTSNDPRVLAKEMNREFDITDASADYFLLNGRSFPYTLRESTVVVAPDEEVLMRVVNAGSKPVSLHTHGHKATIVQRDGVPDPSPVQRDTYTVTAAQRLDLVLNTTDDGLNSYGPGVWFMHDHQEEAVTTDGIGPGGDITVIAYESYLNETTSFPETEMQLDTFFTDAYYDGEIPVWHDLGLPSFLGEVVPTGTETQERSGLPIPGPGAMLAVAAVGAVAVATRSRRDDR